MIAFRIPLFLDHRAREGRVSLMLFFLLGSLVAMFALFRRNLFEHWSLLSAARNRYAARPAHSRAYDAVYLYVGTCA